MENLLFSLQATAPVFLLILLGWGLGRVRLLNESFCAVADKLVFRITLPVMLFVDLAEADIRSSFDGRYVLFCAGVTTVIFLALWGGARLFLRDRVLVGEFVQASYRSSAAILGCAFILNMYGTTGMAPLMILGSVPLFNIYAVLVLTWEAPHSRQEPVAPRLKKALWGVVTNPIILGIVLGLLASLAGLTSFTPIVEKTLTSLSSLTTPLALLSIGAAFRGRAALALIKPSMAAALIKLVLLPALFLPLAIWLGFTGQKLVALLVMLGSTTTPTAYIMAKNMGHEGVLTASVVVLTTVLSAFTLTAWIFLLRSVGVL